MDRQEGISKQRSANTTPRRSCFAKLCCCCCNKEDGGIHDLRNDTWEQADGKKDDRVRQYEARTPGYDTGPEDFANKMKHENRASQNRKGPGEGLHKDEIRPSDDAKYKEERQSEGRTVTKTKSHHEEEWRRLEEEHVQLQELERNQRKEIMHLKTQLQMIENETNRKNMEQAQKMQQMEDRVMSLERKMRNQEAEHVTEIKSLQQKAVESELMRDIDEKFVKSELSGNLQNTAERDKLVFEVHTYFKDTLCDLSQKDDSFEQENLVKVFVVMYRSAVKKISDLVSHFAVAHNYGAVGEAISNIVAQIEAQCAIKEAVSKEMKRIHRPPFYTDREGLTLKDEEWQLFQNAMFLKSVTLKVTQPQDTIKSCLVEVAHESFSKLAEVTRSTLGAEVQEKFISASVPVIMSMILSPNPIIPWIGLETFEAKYVTMDLWEYEEFKEAMKVTKMEGYPIAAFKRPILLTCTYQSVVVEQGFVRMKLNTV